MIIGGNAGRSLTTWLPRMPAGSVRAKMIQAKFLAPGMAGILGSAAGGSRQLTLRDDLGKVRAAVGMKFANSPQKLTREDIRRVFVSFGAQCAEDGQPAFVREGEQAAAGPACNGDDDLVLGFDNMIKAIEVRVSGVLGFSALCTAPHLHRAPLQSNGPRCCAMPRPHACEMSGSVPA